VRKNLFQYVARDLGVSHNRIPHTIIPIIQVGMSYYTGYDAGERVPEYDQRSNFEVWNDDVADPMGNLSISERREEVNTPAGRDGRGSRDDRTSRHGHSTRHYISNRDDRGNRHGNSARQYISSRDNRSHMDDNYRDSHRDGRGTRRSGYDNSLRVDAASIAAAQSTQSIIISDRAGRYDTRIHGVVSSADTPRRGGYWPLLFNDDRTQRVMDQCEKRMLPLSPEYKRSDVDYRVFTDAHYIRVERLEEDVCANTLSGRWKNNAALRRLVVDYYNRKVEKYSWQMLYALDSVVTKDDEALSRGCPDDIPFSPNLDWSYKLDGRTVVETTDFALDSPQA
jgi:hypothetical protein